jgi:hypothetical protein
VFGSHDRKRLEKTEREVECLHRDVQRLLRILSLHRVDFIQLGGCMPTDFSIVAGSSGIFNAILTPPNGAQAAGTVPSWSASDASVTLTPSADGLNCVAAVPATDTAASFDLQITAVSADASVGTVKAAHTITIVQPTPPPPALTAIDFAQSA